MDSSVPFFAWKGGSHSCADPLCGVEAIESDFDCAKGIDLGREIYVVVEAEGYGCPFRLCSDGHEHEEGYKKVNA